MALSAVLLVIGFVLLFFGAEGLVKGAASLARRAGISPLVIGLTIVAYGTSMPELVVSTKAALTDQGDIALGNVVGSNIFNIAVILGLAAVICPLKVRLRIIRRDMPVLIGAALLLAVFVLDARVSRLEGAILLAGAVVFSVLNIIGARRTTDPVEDFDAETPRLRSGTVEVAYLAGGLVLLVVGSNALVTGSVVIARSLGISEAVIGLTIIAAGTSLPELATSAVASLRREADIAIANVVGSNIFNVLGIVGVSASIHPMGSSEAGGFNLLVMIGLSVVLLPFLRTGLVIHRTEGAILLAVYGLYLAYLLVG